jgi:hypothetical protein
MIHANVRAVRRLTTVHCSGFVSGLILGERPP